MREDGTDKPNRAKSLFSSLAAPDDKDRTVGMSAAPFLSSFIDERVPDIHI
jgi:hypothetical protein